MSEYIRFATKRDFEALGECIKRSALGNKEPGVLRVEPVPNPEDEVECDHSWRDDRGQQRDCTLPAAVRVVRNHGVEYDEDLAPATPTNIYSEAFCLDCIERALTGWLDDQVERMERAVGEARADEAGRHRHRYLADGGQPIVADVRERWPSADAAVQVGEPVQPSSDTSNDATTDGGTGDGE